MRLGRGAYLLVDPVPNPRHPRDRGHLLRYGLTTDLRIGVLTVELGREAPGRGNQANMFLRSREDVRLGPLPELFMAKSSGGRCAVKRARVQVPEPQTLGDPLRG